MSKPPPPRSPSPVDRPMPRLMGRIAAPRPAAAAAPRPSLDTGPEAGLAATAGTTAPVTGDPVDVCCSVCQQVLWANLQPNQYVLDFPSEYLEDTHMVLLTSQRPSNPLADTDFDGFKLCSNRCAALRVHPHPLTLCPRGVRQYPRLLCICDGCEADVTNEVSWHCETGADFCVRCYPHWLVDTGSGGRNRKGFGHLVACGPGRAYLRKARPGAAASAGATTRPIPTAGTDTSGSDLATNVGMGTIMGKVAPMGYSGGSGAGTAGGKKAAASATVVSPPSPPAACKGHQFAGVGTGKSVAVEGGLKVETLTESPVQEPCPAGFQTMSDLKPSASGDPYRGYCDKCQKDVHLVRNAEDLPAHQAAGHCVAAVLDW
eukprot:m.49845 g.49845  ORF g.49845 m.49845 type:complete len:374 (+) comp12107_c0_seq1:164-1285(+)